MAESPRTHYLEQLIARRDNGRVKIITGVRRCGKSYLLNVLYKRLLLQSGVALEHIIEIALDEVQFARYRNPIELDALIRSKIDSPDQTYYVFIDEIQFCTEEPNPYTSNPADTITFVDTVMGLSKLPNVDLYITGSNSKMLSTDILTQFEDRGDEVHLNPLSFAEYLEACDDKEYALRDYLVFGGMPRLLALHSVEEKSRYLKDLFAQTYTRDVIERNHLRGEAETLDILLDFTASSVGSLTNPTKLSNRFLSERKMKVGNATIDDYLRCFQEAFIIDRVLRFDIKGGGYFKTPSKYYFTDIGLRNARLNFRQNDANHMMENVVYNDLMRRGFNVDVGVVNALIKAESDDPSMLSYSSRQFEVDFVANQISSRYYVQVALGIDDSGKREQETFPLRKIGDSFKKIVVIRDDIIPWHDDKGILYLGLERFLLDDAAIDL